MRWHIRILKLKENSCQTAYFVITSNDVVNDDDNANPKVTFVSMLQ